MCHKINTGHLIKYDLPILIDHPLHRWLMYLINCDRFKRFLWNYPIFFDILMLWLWLCDDTLETFDNNGSSIVCRPFIGLASIQLVSLTDSLIIFLIISNMHFGFVFDLAQIVNTLFSHNCIMSSKQRKTVRWKQWIKWTAQTYDFRFVYLWFEPSTLWKISVRSSSAKWLFSHFKWEIFIRLFTRLMEIVISAGKSNCIEWILDQLPIFSSFCWQLMKCSVRAMK